MNNETYKIIWAHGCYLSDKKGNSTFNSQQEAIDVATEFKNNPRSHNVEMSDSHVDYWKSQTYTIIKEFSMVEEIIKI